MIRRLERRSVDRGGVDARRVGRTGVRADQHRHGARHRQGRAGRRHSRRDRHADQRSARHALRAGRDQRERRLRVRQRDGRHLHGRGDARVLQDLAAFGHRRQPRRARRRSATLALEVGGASETVDVKGEAPQVQSSSGERSFSVTTDEVTNLPIATRNFADLINLTPGVVNGNRAGDSPSTGGGSQQLHDGRRLDDGAGQQPADGRASTSSRFPRSRC